MEYRGLPSAEAVSNASFAQEEKKYTFAIHADQKKFGGIVTSAFYVRDYVHEISKLHIAFFTCRDGYAIKAKKRVVEIAVLEKE